MNTLWIIRKILKIRFKLGEWTKSLFNCIVKFIFMDKYGYDMDISKNMKTIRAVRLGFIFSLLQHFFVLYYQPEF